MKFNYNGNIVEIKVTPENGKKVDAVQTESLYSELELAVIHAQNFCTGNGWHNESKRYANLAHSMMNNKL